MQNLAIGTTNLVELNNLVSSTTGAYIDTATVTVTVKDLQTGADIAGETWPVSMASIGSGNYRGALSALIEIDRNKQYIVDITAVDSGVTANWQTTVSAVVED